MSIEIIIIACIFLILVLALLPILIRRTVVATIEGFSWTLKVLLEHYIWVEESSYSGFPYELRVNLYRKIIKTNAIAAVATYDFPQQKMQ